MGETMNRFHGREPWERPQNDSGRRFLGGKSEKSRVGFEGATGDARLIPETSETQVLRAIERAGEWEMRRVGDWPCPQTTVVQIPKESQSAEGRKQSALCFSAYCFLHSDSESAKSVQSVDGFRGVRMRLLMKRQGFPKTTLTAIREDKILRIRAGSDPHRMIGIWAVVVEGRVFVRSWSLKPRSWYRTFLEEPQGEIEVNGRTIPVRAVFTRSERVKDAVERAYAEKYTTPASLKYVQGFKNKKRRDTTTELVPL